MKEATLAGLAAALFAVASIVSGCSPEQEEVVDNTEVDGGAELGAVNGTSWQLVEFQSMSDEIGTIRPDDPTLYTMSFKSDGTVSLRLNCNQANGSWSATSSSKSGGSMEFGPLAMTRAICPPPSMDERIARDSAFVRSYIIDGDRLYLSLMADAGIYAWERLPDSQ